MISQRSWSVERATGVFLVVGFVANLAGVLMFLSRGGIQGGDPPSLTYFTWERSFLAAAVILTAIGFMLLEAGLQNTAGRILARTGATGYLVAGTLLVVAEAFSLSQADYAPVNALIVVYVVLAFLAQAAWGGALLQSGLLPAWIGWGTMVWNLAWLVVLPVTTPGDMYFPILHHLMPLVMGIGLLRRAP